MIRGHGGDVSRPRLKAALVATVILLSPACAATEPAPSPTARDGLPAQDEIRHSPNMKLVANVPLAAPFDGPDDWGTDMAFQGRYAFVGNYGGFTVHDIGDPEHPKAVARVRCPSGQNDISVSGDLLFLSVDEPRTDDTCASDLGDPAAAGAWEGIRIFDISDKTHPRYLKSVRTECGSHTHTVVPGKDDETVYLYVSSPGPNPDTTGCAAPHQNISIVEVPRREPGRSRVVAKPELFAGRPAGEDRIGGCHDITVYPEKDLAAGACFGDGVLLDISDRVRPKLLQTVRDEENFSIWHSATFNNEGTKVVFSDEMGGGAAATCLPSVSATKGADAIYALTPERRLVRQGFFKIPRVQGETENCVAHNGALVPVPGRDVMVQGWYMGGVSVWEFTDPAHPREIAYFERGPLAPELHLGGSWSAYYYNGYIYSSDITKGLDVLRVDDPVTDPAKAVRVKELNAQSQRSY